MKLTIIYFVRAQEGSSYPLDATIPAPKFVIRDFVVGTNIAIIGNITADGSKIKVGISFCTIVSK